MQELGVWVDVFTFCLGLIVGSFLNVCIWRMPRNESIVWPGSACPVCKKAIAPYDNIPVISWLVLGGKCRGCKTRIPVRYPFVELCGGFAVWLAFEIWGLTPYGAAAAAWFCAFIAIAFIDAEHEIIPDEFTYAGIVAGPVFSFFFPAWHGVEGHWQGLLWSLAGFLTGGGVLYGMGVLGEKLFNKPEGEAMGGGDVKLMAAVGAFLGWKGVLTSLFLASLAGSIVGLPLKYVWKREHIPFGPFLVLGIFIYMLWGERILSWYFESVLQYS